MDTIHVSETDNEVIVTIEVTDDVILVNPPPTTSHESLTDLAGGAPNDHSHLTAVQLTQILALIVGGGAGTFDHNALNNRGIADQHPIGAVTGLQGEVDKITKLLELQSTSWISGAAVSINGADPTKFDITGGVGQHVDHSTHPPTITEVIIAGQTGVSVTNIATQTVTEIAVDKNGNLIQQFKYTSIDRRDYFTVGSLAHPNFATITNAQNLARVINHEAVLSLSDLALAIGSLTIQGGVVQPNGANLSINITSATTFVIGINKAKIKDPNYVRSGAISLTPFFRIWKDGVGGFNIAPSTTIDPNNYDDGTGGAGAPNGTVLPNKWQLLRVYFFPVESPGVSAVAVHYGTDIFGTAEEALADLGIDFTPHPVLVNSVHRANIAVKQGVTNLSDILNAVFQAVGKFGHTGGGGSAGVGVTDHELLSNLLGGATNDHQHLTTAELTKLTNIEDNATTDQTKSDIDALGIDAETLDGLDSTDFELFVGKDATSGYVGLTLFKINFKNAANTFISFFTNANTAARTYTFQNRDGTIADDTDLANKEDADATILKDADIGSSVQAFDLDTLKADASDELSVGFTTTVEVLGSDTITPNFTTQSLKTRTASGNITISNPSTGQGIVHIILTIDGTDRTLIYGSEVKPIVGAPTTLIANKVYLMTLVRDTSTHTVVSLLEVA